MAVMALLLDQDRCTKNFNIYWDRTGTNEWMLVRPGCLGQLVERPAAGTWPVEPIAEHTSALIVMLGSPHAHCAYTCPVPVALTACASLPPPSCTLPSQLLAGISKLAGLAEHDKAYGSQQ